MAYYPEQQLMKDEEIIERAIPTYWSYFWVILLLGVIGGLFTFGITSVIAALWVYLGVRSQQVALTNKRVIGKYGIISRVIVDVPLSKISSVSMDQGFIGRIFGFGNVLLKSMGGETTPVPSVSKADSFRSKIAHNIV